MTQRASAVLIAAFFVGMQALVLPPDGFVTGDQGSKYLQTKAFAGQGPLNPAIDVRSKDIDPEYRRLEPKLKYRRGRVVSEFLWLLPMLGAPFMRLLGIRGIYVVPAVSVLAVFLAAAALTRELGDRRATAAAWVAVFATPIVVYGLEIWEHAPAAACVMAGAVLLRPQERPPEGESGVRAGAWRARAWRAAAAGAAIACGWLFREEVIVALPALLIGRATTIARDRPRDLFAAGGWAAAGVAAVAVASVPVNLMMYGAALPMHITQDAWEYAKNISYLQVRRDLVTDLLLPGAYPALYGAAFLAGVVASVSAARRESPPRPALVVVHAAVATTIGLGVVVPLVRLAAGAWMHVAYNLWSAAHTWPFAMALLYWPWLRTGYARRPVQRPVQPLERPVRRLVRYLLTSAVLLLAFTLVIVPSTGGGQWSPRFLLSIAPLLAIPAALMASWGRGPIVWIVRGVLCASVAMQVTGIVFVRQAKQHFASVTHTAEWCTAPGDVIISTIYWFPEVTATLAPTRRLLFSWNRSDVPAMAALAVKSGFTRFDLVTQPAINGDTAPAALDLPGTRCRAVRGREFGLDPFGLTLSRYSCPSR